MTSEIEREYIRKIAKLPQKKKSVARAHSFHIQGGKKPFGRWKEDPVMNLGAFNLLPTT